MKVLDEILFKDLLFYLDSSWIFSRCDIYELCSYASLKKSLTSINTGKLKLLMHTNAATQCTYFEKRINGCKIIASYTYFCKLGAVTTKNHR